MTSRRVRVGGALVRARPGVPGTLTGPSMFTPPTPPPGGSHVETVLGPYMPANDLISGAMGEGVWNESTAFGDWRGAPVLMLAEHIHGTSADPFGAWQDHSKLTTGRARNFPGLLDLSPGGPVDYAAAKNGAYDTQVRDYVQTVKGLRTFSGKTWPTIWRFFHECNGNWYHWSVDPADTTEQTNFKLTANRWKGILVSEWPEAIMSFGMSADTYLGATPQQLWPGDDTFDVYGDDQYNQYPYIGTANDGTVTTWSTALMATGSGGAPRGIGAHRQLAEDYGVPIYLPEYANNADHPDTPGQCGDDPHWVNNIFPYMRANRGFGPGQFFADCWFNYVPLAAENNKWHIYAGSSGIPTKQPNVAAAYQALFPAPA